MSAFRAGLAAFLTVAAVGQDLALEKRIREGGWLEPSRWRRGDDGALQMHYFADAGGEVEGDRFVPVLGEGLEDGLRNAGAIGWLALLYHGPDDLLGMTDAEYHFGALGIDPADVALRQFLAVPPPALTGSLGRAHLLDRLLAIGVLQRRRHMQAMAEFQAIAANEALPTVLRERARCAHAAMAGTATAPARRRLTAERLLLPAAFDGCIVVDHALLPDMSWLCPLGRRLSALVTMRHIMAAGGTVSPAACNGAQRLCDVVSELPFGVVHRFGNARVDQSCLVVQVTADGPMPVSLSWQAAGDFELARWQGASLPEGLADEQPLLAGTWSLEADRAFASTAKTVGIPRPAVVEQWQLLAADGSAVRVIVPGNSKLWTVPALAGFPPATGAQLRVTFGDPALVEVAVAGRDEDGAVAWVAKVKGLLARNEVVRGQMPGGIEPIPEWKQLAAAVAAAKVRAEGTTALVSVEVRGFTVGALRAIAEALVPLLAGV